MFNWWGVVLTLHALMFSVCNVQVDRDTLEMLKSINMGNLPGVQLAAAQTGGYTKTFNK